MKNIGIFFAHLEFIKASLVYFKFIGYFNGDLVNISPVLVHCVTKNLAALPPPDSLGRIR
jgi:hypothetical protein